MTFNFLEKQSSRREMLRGSATLAGSVFVGQLFPATLLRASAMSDEKRAPSPADLLASMRAKFNAAPLETQKLADNVTLLSGPGGKRGSTQRPRRQIRCGHFRCTRLAQAQRSSRWPWQRTGEIRH